MSSEIYIAGPNYTSIFGRIYLAYTEFDFGVNAGYYNALQRGSTALAVRPGDERVTSTFLVLDTGTDEEIREKFNNLVNILESGRIFHSDPFTSAPAYIYHKTETETAVRSIIYDYAIDSLTEALANPLLIHGEGRFQIAITHANYWEPVDPIVVETGDVSATGGVWNINDHEGVDYQANTDSRIGLFRIQHQSGQLARAYCGIHINRGYGGTFDPWIDSSDMNPRTDRDTTSETPSTGASGNESLVCDFGDIQSLIGRAYVLSSDFTATPNAYIGSFLVMLRYKLSSAGEVGVRMKTLYGTSELSPSQLTPVQYLTSTNYTFAELGELTLPPHPYRFYISNFDVARFGISIEAERISGTPSLHIDGLLLLPATHYFRADIGDPTDVEVTDVLQIITDADGSITGVITEEVVDEEAIKQQATVTAKNWFYPYRGGVFVLVTLEGAGVVHSLNRLLNLDVEIYEHFRLYEAHQG